MLIRAMPRVVRIHRVEVVLAGCGTDERRLRRLATRLGSTDQRAWPATVSCRETDQND